MTHPCINAYCNCQSYKNWKQAEYPLNRQVDKGICGTVLQGKSLSIKIVWAIGAYKIGCEFESRQWIFDSVCMTFSKGQN